MNIEHFLLYSCSGTGVVIKRFLLPEQYCYPVPDLIFDAKPKLDEHALTWELNLMERAPGLCNVRDISPIAFEIGL